VTATKTPTVVISNDADRDGIPDTSDRCPNEAEDLDGDMDLDGCPEQRDLVEVSRHRIRLAESIYFETNTARIKAQSFPLLDAVASVLTDNPNIHIRIEGHTDSVGSEERNEELSQQRAQSVLDALVSRGVSASRMEAVGFGQRQPMESNDTEEGRQQNRRVEIHITKR
jgi:outer membrane protein OmpA-like peptidoglycan-associated protein